MRNMQVSIQYTNKEKRIHFIDKWRLYIVYIYIYENDYVYKLKYTRIKDAITR